MHFSLLAILPAALAAFGLYFTAISITKTASIRKKKNLCSVTADAKIVGTQERQVGGIKGACGVYEFRDSSGKLFRCVSDVVRTGSAGVLGHECRIGYAPDDPQTFVDLEASGEALRMLGNYRMVGTLISAIGIIAVLLLCS